MIDELRILAAMEHAIAECELPVEAPVIGAERARIEAVLEGMRTAYVCVREDIYDGRYSDPETRQFRNRLDRMLG